MNLRKQAGLSLSGFMVWAIIFAVGALVAFKIGPAYIEDATIKKHLRAIAKENPAGTRPDIERAFSRRTEIDRIEAISSKDIQIAKEGGVVALSAQYTTRIPLVHNISACMDFNPTSK